MALRSHYYSSQTGNDPASRARSLRLSALPAALLSVNLGVQGYTGERKGAGGSLDVNWAF